MNKKRLSIALITIILCCCNGKPSAINANVETGNSAANQISKPVTIHDEAGKIESISFSYPNGDAKIYDMPFSREYMRISSIDYYKAPSDDSDKETINNAIVFFLEYDESKQWIASWCYEGESGWIKIADIKTEDSLKENNSMLGWDREGTLSQEIEGFERHGPYMRIKGDGASLELWDDLSIKGAKYFLSGFMLEKNPIVEEIYYDFARLRVYSISNLAWSAEYMGEPIWNNAKDHFIAIGNIGGEYRAMQEIFVVQYMDGVFIENEKIDTGLFEDEYSIANMSVEWNGNETVSVSFPRNGSTEIKKFTFERLFEGTGIIKLKID